MRTMPCRSCGQPIGFIATPSGKHVPVDPDLIRTTLATEPAPAAPRRLVLVTERGEVRSGYEVSPLVPGAEAVEGYISHFATCSDPTRWRR